MNLLGRKKGDGAAEPAPVDVVEGAATALAPARQTTAPKGRPTPKRDAAKRRGPVAPAPMTGAEARRRRKTIGAPKLTRAERRTERAERNATEANRRERMMAGEEGYLMPRDRGPERRYIRDIVDARRNALGLFMPITIGLMFVMMGVRAVQLYMSPAMVVVLAIMIVDGILLGRKVNKLVDAKFPKRTEGAWKLGWYAATRASQLRRMRVPRPQVKRGQSVA